MAEDPLRRAVFLDRDGTIIRDMEFSTDPDGMEILPGVLDALARLQRAGFRLVIITNQSGVARGRFTEESLCAFHAFLRDAFARRGVRFDGLYYCPHYTEGAATAYVQACDCRKPEPGMLHRAARDLNVDLRRSWMVGDRPADVLAGRRAGCRTIRVLTGPPPAPEDPVPDFAVPGLPEAADLILADS